MSATHYPPAKKLSACFHWRRLSSRVLPPTLLFNLHSHEIKTKFENECSRESDGNRSVRRARMDGASLPFLTSYDGYFRDYLNRCSSDHKTFWIWTFTGGAGVSERKDAGWTADFYVLLPPRPLSAKRASLAEPRSYVTIFIHFLIPNFWFVRPWCLLEQYTGHWRDPLPGSAVGALQR